MRHHRTIRSVLMAYLITSDKENSDRKYVHHLQRRQRGYPHGTVLYLCVVFVRVSDSLLATLEFHLRQSVITVEMVSSSLQKTNRIKHS